MHGLDAERPIACWCRYTRKATPSRSRRLPGELPCATTRAWLVNHRPGWVPLTPGPGTRVRVVPPAKCQPGRSTGGEYLFGSCGIPRCEGAGDHGLVGVAVQSCAPAVGTDEGRLRDGRGGGSSGAQDDPAEVAPGGHQVDGLADLSERGADVLRVQPAGGEQVAQLGAALGGRVGPGSADQADGEPGDRLRFPEQAAGVD